MKKYPYFFTKSIKTLLWVLLVLCVVCAVYAVYRAVTYFLSYEGFDFYAILNRALPLLVGIFGFVVAVSMLKRSEYELTEKELIIRFGIIVSRYELSEIERMQFFSKTKKLTLFFKGGRYMVIVVKEEWQRDFVEELLKRNPKISYEENFEEQAN